MQIKSLSGLFDYTFQNLKKTCSDFAKFHEETLQNPFILACENPQMSTVTLRIDRQPTHSAKSRKQINRYADITLYIRFPLIHKEEQNFILLPQDARVFKLMANVYGDATSRVIFFYTSKGEGFHQLDIDFFPNLQFMDENHGACIFAKNHSKYSTHNIRCINCFLKIENAEDLDFYIDGVKYNLQNLESVKRESFDANPVYTDDYFYPNHA